MWLGEGLVGCWERLGGLGVVEWGLGGAAGTYQEVMDWVRYWNVYTQKKFSEEILTTKMGVPNFEFLPKF